MPYTRPTFSTAIPLGSRNANEVDDSVRELRVDVSERLVTIIGADGSTLSDPIVPTGYSLTELKAAIAALGVSGGSAANVERTIGWCAGQIISSTGTVAQSTPTLTLTGASGAVRVIIPVALPVGVTVTQARVQVRYFDADHAITASFRGYSGSNLSYNQAMGAPVVTSLQQWIATGVLSHTTATDLNYVFDVLMENNNLDTATELRLHAVQVKYTHPGGLVR